MEQDGARKRIEYCQIPFNSQVVETIRIPCSDGLASKHAIKMLNKGSQLKTTETTPAACKVSVSAPYNFGTGSDAFLATNSLA